MPKKSFFHKIISVFLCISFLLNGLVLPQGEEAPLQKLYIPTQWGHLHTSSVSRQMDLDVIIIADSHCIPDIQRRIHFILMLLAKQGFNQVALEGSEGKFNSGFFQRMPDQKTARQVADFWLNEGALTGAEMASIFSRDKIDLYGIESRSNYLKSIHIVREAQALYPSLETNLTLFESKWPPVYLTLEKYWNDFEAGKGPLNKVLKASFLNLGPYGFYFFPELTHILRSKKNSDFMKFWMELENLRYLAQESEALARHQLQALRAFKICSFVRKMSVFQMTRREWELYKLLKTNLAGTLAGAGKIEERFFKLFAGLQLFEKFYDLCRRRDKILAKKFIRFRNEKKFKRAVIIAGGFHLQGLLEELRGRGLHVGILFPSMSGKNLKDADYLKVLLGGQRVEHDFGRFSANAISWALAPSPRLSLKNFQGEFIQKAFFAACVALYDVLTAARLTDAGQDWTKALRDNREKWEKGYSKWLGDLDLSEEQRRELLGVFEYVKILGLNKEGPALEVTLQLFGYQTQMRVLLGEGPAKGPAFHVDFPERPPFEALSGVFQSAASHAVVRRTLSGHFAKKLKARAGDAEPIRQYVDVYNRAWYLREKLSRGGGWRTYLKSFVASSDRPHLEKIYGALGKSIQNRGKFLKMLKEDMSARGIEVDFEIVDAEDSRIQGR
jgi:hypothetical protein